MVKPGYRTSEFWFTLVSFIFSGLFLLGLIGNNDQKEELIRDVSHGVESVILIGGQLLILYNYINSRKEIKKNPLEEKKDDSERESGNTANKSRPNKTRSRKTNSKKQRKPKPSTKRSSS